MTKIKFCGLCRAQDAALAADLGASYAGVILTESPRRVSPEAAAAVLEKATGLKRVGVFAREDAGEILRLARMLELDVLQLHSRFDHDEVAHLREEFEGELWGVVGIDAESGQIPALWRELSDTMDALVLDTSVKGRTGGTGRSFNWAAAAPGVREMAHDISIVLAGGLNPENVSEAISQLHPAVVDVASGVEVSAGIKSPVLMAAFARTVRSASIV